MNKYTSVVFAFAVIFVLYTGWKLRDYDLITAEKGLGYSFGIIGFALMTILMLYPLRKRFRFLGKIGDVKAWFRYHMILGIVGPVFILFHCNFQLGSFNSNVALFSMIVVSTSGIFGRLFYARIHYGLYGERANLVDLRKELDQQKKESEPQFDLIPGTKDILFAFSDHVLQPPQSLWESLQKNVLLKWEVFRVRRELNGITRSYLKRHMKEKGWSSQRRRKMNIQMKRKMSAFLRQTLKVAQFGFYERLFGLWHLFHIPLVYMLFLAAVIHIVAVHLY